MSKVAGIPIIVQEKLLVMVVCAPRSMSKEQVQRWVDGNTFAGTTRGWQISEKASVEAMIDGKKQEIPNPVDCRQSPRNRHWVCYC